MPLPERVITPVNISRGTLQCPVPDELEGVTNGTLANIIRQLSSLSRHAEEMFGNLFVEAKNIANRSSNLQARIDQLAIRVTQLDSTVEEVSLQDIQLRKAYVSSQSFDQQVVSRESMPKAMLEAYLACDKPPPLDNLNPYRMDGKDGLKFYTDPNYFFELWRQEMVKDTERMMNDRGKKNPSKVHINGGPVSNGKEKGDKHKKRVRQPTSTMERQRLKAIGQGEYLMSPNSINNHDVSMGGYYNNQDASFGVENRIGDPNSPYGNDRPRPNSIEIQRTYSSSSSNNNYYHSQRNDSAAAVNSHYARNDVSASPNYVDGSSKYPYGHSKQQDPLEVPKYGYHEYKRQDSGGLLVNQLQKQQLQQQQQYQTDQHHIYGIRTEDSSPASSSPSKKRPTQPPPAPPPGATPPSESTPTRSAPKDNNMPPPPPPMLQLIQEVASVVQNGSVSSSNDVISTTKTSQNQLSEPDLPPPPPAPSNQTLSKNTLGASVPASHLPPSPPPPPPVPAAEPVVNASPKKEISPSTGGVPPPPPPPPPPPSNGLINGDARKSSLIQSNSPAKSSILSPSGLKKPQPLNRPTQDNVRSDLLKAIRDGIALKKVEQRAACETSSEEGGGHIDVASILARRVAVEMSDSDEAQSDSECDSDDWGDESTA